MPKAAVPLRSEVIKIEGGGSKPEEVQGAVVEVWTKRMLALPGPRLHHGGIPCGCEHPGSAPVSLNGTNLMRCAYRAVMVPALTHLVAEYGR